MATKSYEESIKEIEETLAGIEKAVQDGNKVEFNEKRLHFDSLMVGATGLYSIEDLNKYTSHYRGLMKSMGILEGVNG